MADFEVNFVPAHPEFGDILGHDDQAAEFSVMADASSSGLQLYHEACIYHPPTRSVFVTSNQLQNRPDKPNPATANKHVKLFHFYDAFANPKVEEVPFDGI